MAKRGRKKKKQQVNINVVVAVMIIASILLAVLIYTNSGCHTWYPCDGG